MSNGRLAPDATSGKEELFGTMGVQRREPKDNWFECLIADVPNPFLGMPNTAAKKRGTGSSPATARRELDAPNLSVKKESGITSWSQFRNWLLVRNLGNVRRPYGVRDIHGNARSWRRCPYGSAACSPGMPSIVAWSPAP